MNHRGETPEQCKRCKNFLPVNFFNSKEECGRLPRHPIKWVYDDLCMRAKDTGDETPWFVPTDELEGG